MSWPLPAFLVDALLTAASRSLLVTARPRETLGVLFLVGSRVDGSVTILVPVIPGTTIVITLQLA
jgi:hypothetical protein